MLSAALVGCGEDPCERLCTQTGRRLRACLAEWPADWDDVDATGRRGFVDGCQTRWSEERAGLEPRELEDALSQCEEAQAALVGMEEDGSDCDHLRALYIWQ